MKAAPVWCRGGFRLIGISRCGGGHRAGQRLDLGDLARAEIQIGMRLVAPLDELADHRHAGRAEQLLELGEVALRQGADAHRALLGASG